MENKEAKRIKKRPLKPSEDEPNVVQTDTKPTKKKKKQSTPKHVQSDLISTKEEDGVEKRKIGVCVVPVAKRFLLLYSFLKKNMTKKVVVVCSSWQAAKFYTDVLKQMKFDSVYYCGEKEKEKGKLSKFNEAESGVLFTDIPVERLEASQSDWIVLYDAPDISQAWLSNEGNMLTFLTTNELKYIDHLKEASVQVVDYNFDNKKLLRGEPQLETLVAKNHFLYTSAVKAYRSYILAYHQRSMKDVFNVDNLDVVAAAASFCFSNPPKIHLE